MGRHDHEASGFGQKLIVFRSSFAGSGLGAAGALYDYASGDPVNFVDPDGRLQKVVAAAQTPQLFSWQGMIEQKLALSVYSANAPSPIPRPTYTTLTTIPKQQPTTWRGVASQALDFVPGVGTVKAGIEAATGYDIVGGRYLSSQERAMAGVSFGVGVATMGGAGGAYGGLSKAAVRAELPLANQGFRSITSAVKSVFPKGYQGGPGAMWAGEEIADNSGGKFLFENWHKGTFPNRTQSVQYHVAKHGNGRTAVEYTQDAMNFFDANKAAGKSVVLKDGTAGIKIQTKTIGPDGKVMRKGGYWTSDGKLVTFWD